MGCVASRIGEEEEVVLICRERKKLMKLAVERRYALAEAHCRYCHALCAVSAAIEFFVACHSPPSSHFFVNLPPPNCSPPSPVVPAVENVVVTNTMFLQQRTSESTKETVACHSSVSSASSSEYEEEGEEEEEEERAETEEENLGQPCNYFHMGMGMGMPPPMPSPQRDFGWDFFNPFSGVRPEVIGGFRPNSDDDLRAVREEEGIPELEEDGGGKEEDKKSAAIHGGVKGNNHHHLVENLGSEVEVVRTVDGGGGDDAAGHGEKGLTVIDTPARGRELLDALKDIEDHFIRAYDSGKDVSRMLEANWFHLQSAYEEIKENSAKLMQAAITWQQHSTSRSSPCKSLAASSSRSSSTWSEYRNDLFEDYGGMAAGSHSLTLGRLYAWEKKLYEEVKAGDNIRKLYESKCLQLRHKDVRGDDTPSTDKTRAAVKDLYSRILVAIRRAESISTKIQKLVAEELQPQIMELLQGLTETWKVMLESHETQNQIMYEVKTYYDCPPSYGKFSGENHRAASRQLETEINYWRECFIEYIAAQKSYVKALHGWLSKFIVPEVEYCSRPVRRSAPPYRANGPPLYSICHDWLMWMENLPDKSVNLAMRLFVKDVRALRDQQGQEQEHKRRVDRLAKELDKRTVAYEKVESRVLENKFLEYKPDHDHVQHHHEEDETENNRAEYLMEKRESLDSFRKKLQVEKEKHHNSMQETHRITLNGFQTGFGLVFDSLVQFSKSSLKMYNDLVASNQNMNKVENPSYIEGCPPDTEGINNL
ncbi:hypothetical protein Dimus_002804 [Dionaea muscipula]